MNEREHQSPICIGLNKCLLNLLWMTFEQDITPTNYTTSKHLIGHTSTPFFA